MMIQNLNKIGGKLLQEKRHSKESNISQFAHQLFNNCHHNSRVEISESSVTDLKRVQNMSPTSQTPFAPQTTERIVTEESQPGLTPR